jgi:tetratricopeptide (TPR) repeat protein
MKPVVCALLGAVAYAAAGGCRYLELRAPGEARAGEIREVPLYLAYPDTLGAVAVRSFLEASPKQAAEMIKTADWQIKALTMTERRTLKALRDLVDGHVREAGEDMAAVSSQAPARLKSVLRVNRALILFLAGFPADAEKDWKAVSRAGSDCEESAWRNLYSLYLGRKDFGKASGLADEVLKEDPRNKWANAAKGFLLQRQGTEEDWERFLKEKSEAQDSLFEIQIAYGQFLKEHKRYEEAVRYYTRGLEGAPGNGPAWLDLADVYYRLGLPFLAQASLEKCFQAGIADPYVYELLGRVLVALSAYAAPRKSYLDAMWGVLDMRDLDWGLDPHWADRCWRLAEKNVESGIPHDLQSRSMTQLLYHLYCHNGRVEAAKNLREDFWFHFAGPAIPRKVKLDGPSEGSPYWMRIHLGYVSGPLVMASRQTDFFEVF